MAREVIWAHAAQEDLEAAAAYIHRDSPFYAAAFVKKTLTAARSLADFPLRGSMVREFGAADIREIIIYSYRLIYRKVSGKHDLAAEAFLQGADPRGRAGKP